MALKLCIIASLKIGLGVICYKARSDHAAKLRHLLAFENGKIKMRLQFQLFNLFIKLFFWLKKPEGAIKMSLYSADDM